MSVVLSTGGLTAHLADDSDDVIARCLEGWLREGHSLGALSSLCPHGDVRHVEDFVDDDLVFDTLAFCHRRGLPVTGG